MPYLAKLSSRLNAIWPLLALVIAAPAAAQASHRVTLVVPEIESIEVSATPVRLVFETPTPGQEVLEATDASASYAITVNTTGTKITGMLDAAYDEGMQLRVRLAPPPGAQSLGAVELGPSPRDLVSDVSQTSARGLTMAYTASVDVAASLSGVERTRVVTYTITDQ